MDGLILALDVGSSSCKAVLFDPAGTERLSGKTFYSCRRYGDDDAFVEQNPTEVWEAVGLAIGDMRQKDPVRARHLISQIQAVVISGQISSYFFVDNNHHPLCPIISWMDTRSVLEASELQSEWSVDELFAFMGARLPIGPSWPIPKIRWFSKHLPSVINEAKHIVQPKDWIIWNLTGRWVSDASSLRGLIHQSTGRTCDELLRFAGIHPSLIPSVALPYDIVGSVSPHVAAALEIPSNIPVVLGWNDLNSAVLGTVGIGQERLGFDITGTSEHIGVVSQRLLPEAIPTETMEGINWVPLLDSHELTYGVTSSGGQTLQWYMDNIVRMGSESGGYPAVLKEVANVSPGAEGLIFLPYLIGERSPWWNPNLRGALLRLGLNHDRRHITRAVLEGVAYALRTIFDRISPRPAFIVASGGSSKLDLWTQIKAEVLGLPIIGTSASDAACLGSAILGAHALGWYESLEDAAANMIHRTQTISPDPANVQVYHRSYQDFLDVFDRLAPWYESPR